jgi:iron complex transport system permease protein
VKRWGPAQFALTLLAALAGSILVAAACLLFGSTGIGWPTRPQWEERINPVVISSLVGAALASAGVVYQAILRNPLADPYLLGVSSGASLGVYLWALPFAASTAALAGASQQLFAFAGAMFSVAIVFGLSQRRGRLEPLTMLLVGVIVNAMNGAIFLLLVHLNLSRDIAGASGGVLRFLVGGIQTNLTLQQPPIWISAGVIGAGWIIMLLLAGPISVATLGEAEAAALGVGIHRLRWTAMIAASLVTASAVAISGPIGFVGLICPHLGRLLVGADQRRLLPIATALGAMLLASADAASRALASPRSGLGTQLPVGVLTGLLGGPFFLALLWRKRA